MVGPLMFVVIFLIATSGGLPSVILQVIHGIIKFIDDIAHRKV